MLIGQLRRKTATGRRRGTDFHEVCLGGYSQPGACATNPSSAVRRLVALICKDLRILEGGFLHYILQGILNDSILLRQVQAQVLQ
jgi:hypothetical protein